MSYAKIAVPGPNEGESRTQVRHVEVAAEQAGQRLDNYLLRQLGQLPRSRIYRVIRKGEVRVNGRRADPATRLNAGDRVRIPPLRVLPAAEAAQPGMQLRERLASAIIYQDEKLLVLDKPAGIAVHGGSGLSLGVIEALRAMWPGQRLELVHRLDRDTSGCLLVARHAGTLRTLHALLREEGFEKRYLTLVQGRWQLGAKRIDVPLRTDTRVGGERTVRAAPSGKPSVSEFRPVQFFGKTATLMEVILHTGRTHQIRVHAALSGHPVAGDEKYGAAAFNEELRALGLKRMFLHAHSVSFSWPQGGEFSVNAPLPPELAQLLETLAARTAARSADAQRGSHPQAGRDAQAAGDLKAGQARARRSRHRAASPRAR